MEKKRPNSGETQQRSIPLAIRQVNEEERRISVSFSSETPVNRWYGQEILCHDEECVDFMRLNEMGVSLFNHDRDKVIGRIENAICNATEKRTYCDIVFDDDEESEKIYKKVRQQRSSLYFSLVFLLLICIAPPFGRRLLVENIYRKMKFVHFVSSSIFTA